MIKTKFPTFRALKYYKLHNISTTSLDINCVEDSQQQNECQGQILFVVFKECLQYIN